MCVKRELDEKIKQYLKEGRVHENFVIEAIENTLGGTCEKATEREDKYDHIDFFWNTPKGERIGVDVKGTKKNKQKDDKFDDSIHWVEIINVNGYPGWIYGKSKYIAFRTFSDIIFVDTEKLRDYALEKMKGKEIVYSNPVECYVPYQRYGRKDMIIKVPTNDLRGMASFSIVYSLTDE